MNSVKYIGPDEEEEPMVELEPEEEEILIPDEEEVEVPA